MEISLNKFISDTGYCSRREADRLIEAGRVMLNNRVAVTGNRYKPGDEVVVDGSLVKPAAREKRIIMAFNKPVGITTTTDTNIRGNIITFINYPKRIFPIGRLDKDSEGLIFLTNDGDVVNKILRAGNQHEKEYAVRVDKAIDGAFLRQMSEGVRIEGTRTLPCKMRQTGRHSFNIILIQGLNRQIRKMCEALGYKVTALQRTRIMHVKLDKLAVGKWRYLSEPEIEALYGAVEGSRKEEGGSEQGAVSREQKRGGRQQAGGGSKAGGERREARGSEQKAVSSEQGKGRRQGAGGASKAGGGKKTSYREFRKKGKKRN